MNLLERAHGRFNLPRRARILAARIAELLPPDAAVLDVGTGDGQIAALVSERRPDVRLRCIDVTVRERTNVPVERFDGRSIPFEDSAFDVVTFVDVLHHADDAMLLLREAVRVAKRSLVIKDHTRDGWLAGPTLRFMDRVGNRRFEVASPGHYWPEERWLEAFDELQLRKSVWVRELALYPWFLTWAFDRRLHFLARLDLARFSTRDRAQ